MTLDTCMLMLVSSIVIMVKVWGQSNAWWILHQRTKFGVNTQLTSASLSPGLKLAKSNIQLQVKKLSHQPSAVNHSSFLQKQSQELKVFLLKTQIQDAWRRMPTLKRSGYHSNQVLKLLRHELSNVAVLVTPHINHHNSLRWVWFTTLESSCEFIQALREG